MKKTLLLFFAIAVGMLVFFGFFWDYSSVFYGTNTSEKELPNKVGKVEISLNGTTLEEINSHEKNIVYPGNEVRITLRDATEQTYQNVEIKGRGNSTWMAEKKPYALKFQEKMRIFGLRETRNYVLLAMYYDYSYLRAELAGIFEEKLGFPYFSRGEFVELFVDGEYIGLYYITEKINSTFTELKDNQAILAELDNIHKNPWETFDVTEFSDAIVLADNPSKNEGEDIVAFQKFMKKFSELEKVAKEGDFAKFAEIADVDSFARYFIISEFSNNLDAYKTSCYFYQDGTGDKIHAGPAWDYDLAFGNGDRVDDEDFLSTSGFMEKDVYSFDEYSELYYDLMKMPKFKEKVFEIYLEKIFGHEEEIFARLEQRFQTIREYADKDEEKWHEGIDAEEKYHDMIEWVRERFEFFREYLVLGLGD